MRSIRLRLHPDAAVRHPMHTFVVRREGFTRTRLVHGGPSASETTPFVFRVEGEDLDVAAYEAALEATEAVETYRLDRRDEGMLYAYVLERQSSLDRRLTATFAERNLVTVPPVDFEADGTIRLSLVGPADVVQQAVEGLPASVSTDVVRVGSFDATSVDSGVGLTSRQREAVEAAVDCGYYGVTREGSVADVADAIGCATTTAAEHLRKAEKRVMSAVVEGVR